VRSVSLSRKAQVQRDELRSLADNLPFRVIALPDYAKKDYTPERVRQPRQYVGSDSNMQAVGRFLVERGTVELLAPAQTLALFTEMHWCGWQIQRLAKRDFRSDADVRSSLVDARRHVSAIEAAEEELFIANRRLVVNCVKPYFWVGQVWLSDFLQEGSKALCNAVRKFDFTRGTPFFSYAQTAIQNRLRNFFRDHVRAGSFGVRPSREMMMVKNVIDAWRRDFEEEPPDDAVAKIADLPVERIAKLRTFLRHWEQAPTPPVSLDAMISEDGADLYDVIKDEEAPIVAHAAEASEVWAAVDKLPERARYIMRLRFLEGRTLEETGRMLSLTRARIKQIQDASVKKVRQMLGGHRAGR
jgi:RNA polymerase primary sigma factor